MRILRLLAAFLCALQTARACSVPVFRYALERWESASYRAIVYYRGALTGADKESVEALRIASEGATAAANVHLELIDLDNMLDPENGKKIEPQLKKIWAGHKDAALPLTVLMYPDGNDELQPFWSGKLDAEVVAKLISSPARKEILRRLLAGDSAVWVLLQTGDAQKDDAASKMLAAKLDELQAAIKLPTDDDSRGAGPMVRLRSDLPLKISFSIFKLSRSDPAEAMLVAMLVGMDKNFSDAALPVAYPIFGRGRALAGLSGADFAPQTIEEASMFLSGACSCQVKELNPGVDLLFDTDWDTQLMAHALREEPAEPAAPLPKLPVLTEKKSEPEPSVTVPLMKPAQSSTAVQVQRRTSESAVVEPSTSNRRNWLIEGAVASGILVIVSGLWLAMSGRRKRT